jgi:hypothetical protein
MGWQDRADVDYSSNAALNAATGSSAAAGVHGLGGLGGPGSHRADAATEVGAAGELGVGSASSAVGAFFSHRVAEDDGTNETGDPPKQGSSSDGAPGATR